MTLLRAGACFLTATLLATAQSRLPLAATADDSAAQSWLTKTVHDRRILDDMTRHDAWTLQGKGEMTLAAGSLPPRLRVNITLQGRDALPTATALRAIPTEDWRPYNRLSFWLRTDVSGFPALTLIVGIRNKTTQTVSAVHLREAEHNVTVPNGQWTHVVWEIPHVLRDQVTALTFRPWVNKRLPAPSDAAAYEIGQIELQRVDADHYEGWDVASGKIAFSHTGYLPEAPKTAVAGGIAATEFRVLRASTGDVVLRKRVTPYAGRLGQFQLLDFSELREPGSYILRAGDLQTRPFRIAADIWDSTIAKSVNFFYGERCGMAIPGLHDECHRDWLAVLENQKTVMNGGWHDAGDLSQGLVNTGEATYAMFSLAADARASGRNPAWLPLLVDEARWGLAWVHKVRFPGGFRVGFAGMNIWTNGILGDADDRTGRALNNPNVNYIAAAAGAAAARYLSPTDPELARKSLAIAEEDWRYAINGVESPANLSTPAFAATDLELASIGIIASVELYRVTGRDQYARKAWELAAIVAASQQTTYVGRTLPLSGFFYTGPDHKGIFHQFHRGNDQAPLVAMSLLCDAFPNHADWMRWYAVAARYSEYQKHAASVTAPYGVLPAYVYRDDEWQTIPEGDRYGSSRETFRQQVLAGTPIGDGYYVRAFPVWFTRRGNYGVLLSQTKALSAVARLRGDPQAADLLQTQLQWVVGRNPFSQSTMWGEGYDYVPLYSVSVGDIVGALPVGMMTHENADSPYWPASNTYVFKEVWVHSAARWLAIMQDQVATPQREPLPFAVTQKTDAGGAVTITVDSTRPGPHRFTVRSENLQLDVRQIDLPAPGHATFKGRAISQDAPWIAVVIADGHPADRRDVVGYASAR